MPRYGPAMSEVPGRPKDVAEQILKGTKGFPYWGLDVTRNRLLILSRTMDFRPIDQPLGSRPVICRRPVGLYASSIDIHPTSTDQTLGLYDETIVNASLGFASLRMRVRSVNWQKNAKPLDSCSPSRESPVTVVTGVRLVR